MTAVLRITQILAVCVFIAFVAAVFMHEDGGDE